MISVAEARSRILASLGPVPAEQVILTDALGRRLARDVHARRTQPFAPLSAMDGYAVRHEDVAEAPATLDVVGQVPAGSSFSGPVPQGAAVRIFTGAPLPEGTDTIVIQENTEAADGRVTVKEPAARGRHVRPVGIDFSEGDALLSAGRLLTARDIGLAGAMNVPWLMVRRRPRVMILATGDEIVMPGEPMGPNQIVSSNALALAALIRVWGGEPVDLGIAGDTVPALAEKLAAADGADLLVTTGGASVGEHDLLQEALGTTGFALDFWRIAIRPGKPLVFGQIGETPVIGLPGNPVSTIVCAMVFLRPAIDRLLGAPDPGPRESTARLGRDLGANDRREDYLRARLVPDQDGELVAMPLDLQDSSVLSGVAAADCLVIRAPHAPPARAGDPVRILVFEDGCLRP